MRFFVKFPSGLIMPLDFDESDLIESVKLQIQDEVSIRMRKFDLFIGTRALLAEHTLAQSSINDGMTLDVAVWMELEIVVRKRVWIRLQEEGSTVFHVKRILMQEEGIPIHAQNLNYLGVPLQDGETLAEHDIHDSAVLTNDVWL